MMLQPATAADAPQLAALHAASFGDAAWSLQQIESSLALATTQGWIAAEKDKAAGFILVQTTPGEIEILTLAVHPSMQRRGIGERLLKRLMESQPRGEDFRVFLEVAVDNYAAGGLYEKLGFRKTGTRPNYYRRGAVTVDAVLYERILSEQ